MPSIFNVLFQNINVNVQNAFNQRPSFDGPSTTKQDNDDNTVSGAFVTNTTGQFKSDETRAKLRCTVGRSIVELLEEEIIVASNKEK